MAAQVYFADMRAGMRENLHTKLERLTNQAGLSNVINSGDLVAIKMPWVAGAVNFLIVAPGNIRYLGKMFRVRQFFQHYDGLDDVIVYMITLLFGEGTASHREIVELSTVIEIFRYIENEPILVVLTELIFFTAGKQMIVSIGKQPLFNRQ